jgi:hypothetical protein
VENNGSGEPTKIASGAAGGGPRAWTELGEGRGGAQGTSGRSRGGAGKRGIGKAGSRIETRAEIKLSIRDPSDLRI